jgi:hypothetical protein
MPDFTSLGKAGLKGWRQALGDRVANPVAQRTPLSPDQVRALVGGVFFVLAARYVALTARDGVRLLR